jgi:dethiobiotin synthetase
VSTLFVTGSGTDVGKTFVTTLLIGALREAGMRVRALKPIATGFAGAAPDATDTGRLLAALGLAPTPDNVDAVTPWRYTEPLSPDMAAAREGRSVPFAEVAAFCGRAADADVTLIEGIGGVMVPLDPERTVLDLVAALGVPALLVVGSYLGTLSHTLTAAAALRARAVPLAAVIVSESERQPVPLEETAATLARFVTPAPVLLVPRNGGPDPRRVQRDLLRALAPLLPTKKPAGER